MCYYRQQACIPSCSDYIMMNSFFLSVVNGKDNPELPEVVIPTFQETYG